MAKLLKKILNKMGMGLAYQLVLLLFLHLVQHGDAFRSTFPAVRFSRKSSLPSVIECKDETCNFVEEVVNPSKDGFIIVDFYADWCGPCKIAAKTFAAIASEFPDKSVKFVKVNTENHEDTVDDYALKGLPVFGIFKNGQLVKKHEGNIGRKELLEFISQGMREHR